MSTAQDQYEFWRRRIAGENVQIYDGEPQAGFYRLKGYKGAPDQAVAYWFKDGQLRCRIGSKDVSEQVAMDRWTWAATAPISHELYKSIIDGNEWPDQHEAVSRSNRAPDDNSLEGLRDAIEDLAREANTLIGKGAAQSQADADRASDLANKLGELCTKADKARDAEKRPFLEAGREVDAKWKPIIGTAEIYKRVKAAVIEPFLRKQREERARAEAEARRKAEEAARAGDAVKIEEAQRQVQAIAAAPVKAGTRGRSVALRTVTRVVISDRAALLAYFADRQEVTDLLQSLAEKAVKAGITPVGVAIQKDQQAA